MILLVEHLYERLLTLYDDPSTFRNLDYINFDTIFEEAKPPMQFQGEKSRIQCFAHVLNLICKDILSRLQSSNCKEAKELLDAAKKRTKIDGSNSAATGVIAKLRLIILWVAQSPQRIQAWHKLSAKMCKYDVDTQWNSTFDMLIDAFDLREVLEKIQQAHLALEKVALLDDDWLSMEQIKDLLQPFKQYTDFISKSQINLALTTSLFHTLRSKLTDVQNRLSKWATVNDAIHTAVSGGIEKLNKYYKLMKKQDIYYVASVLDPRIKTSWIKKHLPDEADNVVIRIQAYLHTAFPFQPELPPHPYDKSRGIQLDILDDINPYTLDSSDIDTYLDTPVVQWKRPAGKQANEIDQIEWVLNYWVLISLSFLLWHKQYDDILQYLGQKLMLKGCLM
jgi:hypothetical protein